MQFVGNDLSSRNTNSNDKDSALKTLERDWRQNESRTGKSFSCCRFLTIMLSMHESIHTFSCKKNKIKNKKISRRVCFQSLVDSSPDIIITCNHTKNDVHKTSCFHDVNEEPLRHCSFISLQSVMSTESFHLFH